MPVDVGGGGLDTVTWTLYEKELGRTSYALHYNCVGRPSNILLACAGEQRERYLLPSVRGERVDCLAMTEPGAGSDLRAIRTTAVEQGGDFVINGTKHFISHADHADFVILFAATGTTQDARGSRALLTAFLVDMGQPGLHRARRATATSRIAATTTASSSSTTAASRAPPCSARCTRASRWPTPGWAQPACKWRPRASVEPSARSTWRSNGRSTACSSVSRSAASRA